MFPTAITLIAGALGLFWALKARNLFTKATSLLLTATSLLTVVPYQTLQSYVPFAIGFACIMAGFEPTNSIRIKRYHKVFFGVFGILFAIVAVDSVVTWPYALTLWPVVVTFLLLGGWLLRKDRIMLRTRLGVLSIWAGMSLNCLLSSF